MLHASDKCTSSFINCLAIPCHTARLSADRSGSAVHSGFQTSPASSINHAPTQASNHFGFLFVISLN